MQIVGPKFQYLVNRPGWKVKICISNMFPGDTDASGSKIKLLLQYIKQIWSSFVGLKGGGSD